MPAGFGDGTAEGPPVASAPRDVGRPAMGDLYYEYAAYLYDYCEGLLRNQAAAASALQDTLVAAEAEIGKLTNPDRLRPWLYSIARRQCRRELPAVTGLPAATELPATGLPAGTDLPTAEPPAGDDFAEEQAAADADTGEIDVLDIEAEAREREILLVVTAALDGLSDRDREVLSLAFRHGFDGPDLAAVLGLSGHGARAMLSGASARFEKSATAVVVLRAAWAGCGAPDNIVGDWDPVWAPLTPKLRKRLSRHIDSCDTCSRISGYQAYGPEFLSLVPLAIPSAALREQIARSVFDAEPGAYPRALALRVGPLGGDGFPAQPPAWRTAPRVLAASAALVVLLVAGALIHAATTTAVSPDAATRIGAGLPRLAEAGLPGSPARSGSLTAPAAGRRGQGTRQPALYPGALGLTPAPEGVLPVPTRPARRSPSPSHSRSPGSPSPWPSSPSPFPSPTTTSPSPSPSPTTSSPSPSPTTTSPSPTASPSPSSSSPSPDPTTT